MDIEKTVEKFPRKHREGFTKAEIAKLLEKFPGIDMDCYYDALQCNTVRIINGEVLRYPVDIILAIKCGMQKRGMYGLEFD